MSGNLEVFENEIEITVQNVALMYSNGSRFEFVQLVNARPVARGKTYSIRQRVHEVKTFHEGVALSNQCCLDLKVKFEHLIIGQSDTRTDLEGGQIHALKLKTV